MSDERTTVVIKRDTFCGGKLLESGKSYEVSQTESLDLRAAGKAVIRVVAPVSTASSKKVRKSEKAKSKKS